MVTVPGVVTSLPDLDAVAGRVKDESGTVDALFVNAGITGTLPFVSITEEVYDQLFAVNVSMRRARRRCPPMDRNFSR